MTRARGQRPPSRWVPWSGAGAVLGALLWTVAPWLQLAAFGTRPYVGTAFDLVSLVGWLLVATGLPGAVVVLRDGNRAGAGDGRLTRAGVGVTAAGMALVGALEARSALAFVGAGFRPVPATGEDPAGLVLVLAAVLGRGLTLAGAGALGLAFRRVDGRLAAVSGLLLAAPAVPAVVVGLRVLGALPAPIGSLLVGTNVAFVPFGLAWAALGLRVWSVAASDR